MSKAKIVSGALTMTTAAWLLSASFVVPVASAQSSADLQAQISALLAQIAQLQAQLNTGSSASNGSYTFTRNLTVGSRGSDVSQLQSWLSSKGYSVSVTGYFGPLTRGALARFQAANGISPAAGFFGPMTRGRIVAMLGGGGNPGNPGGVPPPPAPASGLAVSVAATNPGSGALISSSNSAAARVPVLAVNFTAGVSGAVNIADIKIHKNGVLADSSISGAYLTENGKVLAQYSSISGGTIDFAGLALQVAAGQTRTFVFGIDPATNLSAGNTVSFSLNGSSDVSATDATTGSAVTASGFPVNGNVFTVTSVSNPAIATVTITSSSVGTSVTAGTQNVLVSQWTITPANSAIKLGGINFKVVGSASKTDLKNVKLFINGSQIGATLPSVGADGSAYFDLTANPVRVSTGANNLQVYADVMGSPNLNFDFGILNTYDVLAIDTQYNVPVLVTVTGGGTGSSSGHQISISQGQTTVTVDSATPTGNIAKGASGVTFAKFDLYAAGEAIKLKFLDANLVITGTNNASGTIQNVYLVDDAGVQIGTTISSMAEGTGSGQCSNISTATITCHFGTSSSNINYVIPANTTRVISVRGDVLSTATWTTVQATLPGNTSNLQGLTSSATATSGAANGAALTLTANALTVVKNTGFGNQTYAKGAAGARIGSFSLSAGSAEGVNVSNITVTLGASSTNLTNVFIKVNGVQFGQTKTTLSGSDIITFSGNAVTIAAGQTATVEVFGSILSSATAVAYGTISTLTSCAATGVTTNASISCSPASVTGQSITVSSGPTLTVTLDGNTAPTGQVVMSTQNVNLAAWDFQETSNLEGLKVTNAVLTATTTSGAPADFSTITLTATNPDGTVVTGTAAASSTSATKYVYVFTFTNPIVVAQNGITVVKATGSAGDFTSLGSSGDNTQVQLSWATTSTDLTVLGRSSNAAATPTFTSTNGGTLTVVRAKLTLSSAVIPTIPSGGLTRSVVDDVANLTFNSDPNGDVVTVNTVTLKFQGAVTSTFAVDLIDTNTGTDWNGATAQNCAVGGSTSCSVTFTFSPAPTISKGNAKTVKVRINSATGVSNAANSQDAITITVNANTDVNWGDPTTTNGLFLESARVPFKVADLSYN